LCPHIEPGVPWKEQFKALLDEHYKAEKQAQLRAQLQVRKEKFWPQFVAKGSFIMVGDRPCEVVSAHQVMALGTQPLLATCCIILL
jgi:hypothetical protein